MKTLAYLALGATLGLVSETQRFKRAAHVFRGRPMIYGLTYEGGAIRPVDHLRIDTCVFREYGLIPAIEITPGPSALSRYELKVQRRLSLASQQVRTARRRPLP